MQHCIIKIDDFKHGMDNLPKLHTYAKLTYDWVVQEVGNTLYRTLVQDPNMKQVMKNGVVGIMIQLWIYETSKMMKIG